jgi:hypothetical protein
LDIAQKGLLYEIRISHCGRNVVLCIWIDTYQRRSNYTSTLEMEAEDFPDALVAT